MSALSMKNMRSMGLTRYLTHRLGKCLAYECLLLRGARIYTVLRSSVAHVAYIRRLRRRLQSCSAFTSPGLSPFHQTSIRRSRQATRCRPISQPTNDARASSWTFSTRRAWATPSRWRTDHRRCTGLRIHPSAWPLDHDIASYELIARAFDGKTEGLTRDDILENSR